MIHSVSLLRWVLSLSALVLLPSCGVEKKLTALTVKYETELAKVRDDYYAAQKEITQLNLSLAERKGENNELMRMQDKFQAQIGVLELELQRKNNQALSERRSLNELLSAKDSTVAVQQGQIGAIEQIILSSFHDLETIGATIRDSLQSLPAGTWDVQIINQRIVVVLNEALLFKPGINAKIIPSGIQPLQQIADILIAQPLLFLEITGHHDNQPVSKKNPSPDSWDFTALRATTIARVLSRELEVGAGRITASGKGPYSPIESNETPEGQAQNRRIELALYHAADELPRKLLELIQR